MSETNTEIEQALDIARKTRESILFGKTDLEKSLHGFYTVAQILGRKDEMDWAYSEINGYKHMPSDHRQKIFRRFLNTNKQIVELVDHEISDHLCYMSIAEIEYIINCEDEKMPKYRITDNELQVIKKFDSTATRDNTHWKWSKHELEKVLSSINLELVRKLNNMIAEITYAKIPQNIFKRFQSIVNKTLADSNPSAVSELNISYEGLGKSEDPERIAHVAFACRRLIKAVADNIFPPRKEKFKLKDENEIEIGEEQFINRITAFVDSLESNNRKFLLRKIKLLRDLYGEIPESINKGTHLDISNMDAEMLVIYSYIILGDIILEKEKTNKPTTLSNKS